MATLPPVLALDSLAERNDGPRLPHRLRPRRRPRRRLGRATSRGWPKRVARRLLAIFGRERLRVELQRPLWRHDRARNRALDGLGRAARGRLRGDRQRPQPRSPPRRAPGRARRRPHPHHARGVRAAAARQRELGPRPAGRDGGALRRASRGGCRDRDGLPSACASTSPPRSATATPAPRIPRPTRTLAEICRGRHGASLRRHPRGAGGGAAAGRGAAGDPRPRALGLLPPALRPARARPRGRGRGPRPGLGAQPAARPGAGAARASARSSAI